MHKQKDSTFMGPADTITNIFAMIIFLIPDIWPIHNMVPDV
jgi:hypothetical protein